MSDSDLDQDILAVAGYEDDNKSMSEESKEEGEMDSDDMELAGIDEALLEGEEDKKWLMKLPEANREMVLAERAEKLQRKRDRDKILGAAPADDDDDAQQRQRGRPGRSARATQLDQIAAARERRERGQQSRRKFDQYGSSSDEDQGEIPQQSQDLEEGEEEQPDIATEEATFDDVQKIQMKRKVIQQWFNQPNCDETLPGCLVKIAWTAGHPGRQQAAKYLVGRIEKVETRGNKEYLIRDTQQQCSKMLVIMSRGKPHKLEVNLISNQAITKDEYSAWQKNLHDLELQQLTKADVQQVLDKIEKARNFKYTSEVVKKNLEEKRERGIVTENPVVEHENLTRLLKYHTDNENFVEAEEVRGKLNKIEAKLKQNLQHKQAQANYIDQINQRNRNENMQKLFKKRKNKELEEQADDPSLRRHTAPQLLLRPQAAPQQPILSQEKKQQKKLDIMDVLPYDLLENMDTQSNIQAPQLTPSEILLQRLIGQPNSHMPPIGVATQAPAMTFSEWFNK